MPTISDPGNFLYCHRIGASWDAHVVPKDCCACFDVLNAASFGSMVSLSRSCMILGRYACALLGLLLVLLPAPLSAQKGGDPAGIAWRVQGGWSVGTSPALRGGDPVVPGSLLQPLGDPANHSITLLMPDGQRFLYECFTETACARGFRVPALYRKPDPFALDMLTRIERVLATGNSDLSGGLGLDRTGQLPREEVLAALGADHTVRITGLASRLGNGRYNCELRTVRGAGEPSQHLSLEKTEAAVTLPLPAPGLYVITIADQRNTPRIQLFIAAVDPAKAAASEGSFHKAQAMMKEWNQSYFGWPVHEFQWAYLAWLTFGDRVVAPKVAARAPQATSAAQAVASKRRPAGTTPEPSFTPLAGVFDADTEVTLHCAAPGAVIHYTVDGSEPSESSFVYHAPIVVKATELTVKAFASMPGRADSPVVTGIYRIQDQ